MKYLGIVGILSIVALPSAAQLPPDVGLNGALLLEHRSTSDFWLLLTPYAQTLLGSPQRLSDFLDRTIKGAAVCVESEGIAPGPQGTVVFQRITTYSSSEMVAIALTLVPNGKIAAVSVTSLSGRSNCVQAYATKTSLRLPFDGEWTVMWGGRTLAENYHVNSLPDSYFAYDICATENGAWITGDPSHNTSYPCYGRQVLAPAQGTVIEAVDGIAENIPPYPNQIPTEALGNHVIIDHGNGEFSLLAHMIPGSILVHRGDAVSQGQVVGRCGNSGHSTQPHLHYQISAGSELFGRSLGLPAQFRNYRANGMSIAIGEPVRGQVISP